MFAQDLCPSQIEHLRNSIDFNRKDRAKQYHKSSIFNLQFRLVRVGNWGIEGLKDKINKLKESEFLQFLNS